MKPLIKVLTIAVVIIILTMVVITIASESTKNEAAEIPEGNFTVLSINQKIVIVGEKDITVVYDNNRSVTCWIYDESQRGGISCIPNWQLTPPQNMSNNCNCS